MATLQFLPFPVNTLLTMLLPITLAVERMIVLGFPYRHRSIMTTEMAITILGAMWGVSLIITTILTIIVPVDIVQPFATFTYHKTAIPFF